MVQMVLNKKQRGDYLYYPLLALLSFFFALSGYWEITKNPITYPKTLSMGYPSYFIFSLGIAKILGALVLILPKLKLLKHWVFAGFTFDVIFAFISGVAISSKADCIKSLIAFFIILSVYPLFNNREKALSISKLNHLSIK